MVHTCMHTYHACTIFFVFSLYARDWGHLWKVSMHGAYMCMYAYLSNISLFSCFPLVCAGLGADSRVKEPDIYIQFIYLLQACAGLGEDSRVVQGDGYSQGTQDGVWVQILESQRPAIFDVYSHYRADF